MRNANPYPTSSAANAPEPSPPRASDIFVRDQRLPRLVLRFAFNTPHAERVILDVTIAHIHVAALRRTDPDHDTAVGLLPLAYGVATIFYGANTDQMPIFLLGILLGLLALGLSGRGYRRRKRNKREAFVRAWENLPDVETYMAGLKSNRIACIHCGSTHIHQFGLDEPKDPRREHRCQTCNTTLYRTYGTNY